MGAHVHDGWPQKQDEVELGFLIVHHPSLCFACWFEKGTTASWARMGNVDRRLVAYEAYDSHLVAYRRPRPPFGFVWGGMTAIWSRACWDDRHLVAYARV